MRTDETLIHNEHREQILEHVRNDPFSISLGMTLTKFEAGAVEAELIVQDHMVNAHGGVHGAVIYALADYAFSAACNSYGKTSLGLSTNIQFVESAKPGDRLIARASEVRLAFRTGFYRIEVLNGQTIIATMDAISYRKDRYFIDL